MSVRIMSGYGPQENWDEEKRLPFFVALEIEIEKSHLAGKSVLIEIDANSKLGPKYITGDPHAMSPNGALLAGIIERQNLIVGNGSAKCQGTITRRRNTKHSSEQSVIDIVLFSSDIHKNMLSMHIDEERKHVLTSIRKSKKGVKVKESDHNVIITEFNFKMKESRNNAKTETYNFKNKECQALFKKYTSETNILTSTIDDKGDIDKVIERFLKKLNGCIALTFDKRRVKSDRRRCEDDLYDKRRKLKNKSDAESVLELNNITEAIAEAADKNFKIL
jgi:hypothetical protein